MKFPTLTVAALAVCLTLLGGCKKDIQNQDAIRKGVMNYLSKRSDLLAMDVSVASVEFRQDEATATVHFQAKGNSSPGAGMNWQYILERKGSEWVVKGKAGENAAHEAKGTPPPAAGSPAAPGSMSGMPNTPLPGGAGGLPPGHPSVSGGAGSPQGLPPGHPEVAPGTVPPGEEQQK